MKENSVKMKLGEWIITLRNLNQASGFSGRKLCYMVERNRKIIGDEVDAVISITSPSEGYKAYDKERIDLAQKFSKKDEQEKPVISPDGREYILEDKAGFEKAFKELQEKYSQEIAEYQKQVNEYNTMLTEEKELDVYKINLKEIPEDINEQAMKAIFPFINE